MVTFPLTLPFACSTTVNHGIIIKPNDISAIKLNLTRREDVRTIIGEPSFIWQEKWYYISTIVKQQAFFTPKIIKHDAYAISFQGDVVSVIEHFDEKDIKHQKIKIQKIKVEKPNLYGLFE